MNLVLYLQGKNKDEGIGLLWSVETLYAKKRRRIPEADNLILYCTVY
jgi:hypothetical protein